MTTSKKAMLCILATLALAACGVKPGHVQSPNPKADHYPHAYPAPSAEESQDTHLQSNAVAPDTAQ